jgi:glycosyltransferase involved in cell wall biosynthesis
MALVVMCLNEEEHLGTTLESLLTQSRPAERVLIVDDGSTDRSPQIAEAFTHRFAAATLVRRPPRSPNRDRLASASVWTSFQSAVDQLDGSYDVVAKLDSDIHLTPGALAEVEAMFAADDRLGLTGPYLSEHAAAGGLRRLRGRPEHVAGAVKFYRRACYDDVYPLPPLLNLDMMDEVKARAHGWRTASFAATEGDPLHLRPHGSHDGPLRAFRRWGEGDYVSGSHPLLVLYVGGQYLRQRPSGGVNYFAGWIAACARRAPRWDRQLRSARRREQVRRARERGASVLRTARRHRGPTR